MTYVQTRLYAIFNELREQGVPIGLQDYLLVAKAVREGIGTTDLDALRRLCRLAWAKSLQDRDLCDNAFARLMPPKRRATRSKEDGVLISGVTSSASKDVVQRSDSSRVSNLQVTVSPADKSEVPASIWDTDSPRHHGRTIDTHYHFTPQLPLGIREMANIWRHLRRLQREGPGHDLDLEGTITEISRRGFFLGPVLRPRSKNQTRLLLLIDSAGSMEPYSLVTFAFIESILRAGLMSRTRIFYFHDYPSTYLYARANLLDPQPMEKILAEEARGGSVLIYGDAGAARGNYDQQRADLTKTFLENVSGFTHLYAWLNPLPPERWSGTTAETISSYAAMYPLDRPGLIDIVAHLKGFRAVSEVKKNE